MGLFTFIKDVGAKIFGGKTSSELKAEEKLNAETQAAKKLTDTINQLGLKITDLNIVVLDDTATVKGVAPDQSTKEKVILVIGNSAGIATVDDQMTVEEPQPEAQFYTVVSGDSLSKIAKKYYGDAMKYPEIFEANKPMLKSPDLIYPGQVLRIPAQE